MMTHLIYGESSRIKSSGRGLFSIYAICALRVCSAFHTVSEDAEDVIGSIKSLSQIDKKAQNPKKNSRAETVKSWQRR